MNPASVKVIIVSLLCVITIPLLTLADRFEDAGEELLSGSSRKPGLEGWSYSGGSVKLDSDEPGVAILSLKKGANDAHLYQTLKNLKRYKYLTFSGEIKTENIDKTTKQSYLARLLFISISPKGKSIWNVPYEVAVLEGSNDWIRYEKTFRVYSKEVNNIHAGAFLNRATGRMLVKNLSVKPARERRGYVIIRYITIAVWTLMAIWLIPSFISFRNSSNSNFVLLATGAFIIGAILTPQEFLMYIVNLIGRSLPSIQNYIDTIQNGGSADIGATGVKLNLGHIVTWLHKLAHFFFFLFIGFMVPRLKPALGSAKAFGYLFLFAVAAETMQLFTDGREFSYGDMLFNLMGAGIGLLVYNFIKRFSHRRSTIG